MLNCQLVTAEFDANSVLYQRGRNTICYSRFRLALTATLWEMSYMEDGRITECGPTGPSPDSLKILRYDSHPEKRHGVGGLLGCGRAVVDAGRQGHCCKQILENRSPGHNPRPRKEIYSRSLLEVKSGRLIRCSYKLNCKIMFKICFLNTSMIVPSINVLWTF